MFLLRAVLGENLTCASTTLSSLCACLILRRSANSDKLAQASRYILCASWIALAVAR